MQICKLEHSKLCSHQSLLCQKNKSFSGLSSKVFQESIVFQGRKLLAVSTSTGLSPLMFAIINGQTHIVEEYLTNRNSKNTIYWTSNMIKETKQTIPHLLFQFCPSVHPKILLKRKDITSGSIDFGIFQHFLFFMNIFPEIMNAQDYHGNTPLLKCAMNDR